MKRSRRRYALSEAQHELTEAVRRDYVRAVKRAEASPQGAALWIRRALRDGDTPTGIPPATLRLAAEQEGIDFDAMRDAEQEAIRLAHRARRRKRRRDEAREQRNTRVGASR